MQGRDSVGCRVSAVLGIVVGILGALLADSQRGTWASSVGIRHRVTAMLMPSETRIGEGPSDRGTTRGADLRVFLRISDHAIDSRFYGTAEARFSDVDLAVGASETMLWEDARCHRERGVPKIALVRVEGAIRIGDRSVPVTALGRQLGLRMPADEIVERKGAIDPDGQTLMTIDATTKTSGLAVRIRLKGEPCLL